MIRIIICIVAVLGSIPALTFVSLFLINWTFDPVTVKGLTSIHMWIFKRWVITASVGVVSLLIAFSIIAILMAQSSPSKYEPIKEQLYRRLP